MRYFLLEPEVAGGLGPATVMNRSVHPPLVSKLHFVIETWLGDDLVQTFPCFLVTPELESRLRDLQSTGATFATALVTASDQFAEPLPGKSVPKLSWFKPGGAPGKDDCGITPDGRLVVSARLLHEMKLMHLDHCEVEPFVTASV